jgi:hypothetical protein
MKGGKSSINAVLYKTKRKSALVLINFIEIPLQRLKASRILPEKKPQVNQTNNI